MRKDTNQRIFKVVNTDGEHDGHRHCMIDSRTGSCVIGADSRTWLRVQARKRNAAEATCPDPACAAPMTPWTRGGTRACSANKCPGDYGEYDATKDKTRKKKETRA